MQIPDLLIVSFSQPLTSLDLIESLRLIKEFKRIPGYITLETYSLLFSDISTMSVVVDDPDFVSENLHVLFWVTPTEQQYDIIEQTITELTKLIAKWYCGTLVGVDHYPDQTLCIFCKKESNEDEEKPPTKVVGTLDDALLQWDRSRTSPTERT